MTSRAIEVTARSRTLLMVIVLLALVGEAVVALLAPAAVWAGVLVGALWGIAVALGATLVAAVFVATGARWWNPLRGAVLNVARTLPVPAAALAVFLLLGASALYPWAHAAPGAHELSGGKAVWLNQPFFVARGLMVLLVWLVLGRALCRGVARQISSGCRDRSLPALAIGFLVAFAVTISIAYWDLVMSLEPQWSTTMYSVYGFALVFKTGIAAVLLAALWRQRQAGVGVVAEAGPALATLGSLLLAFSFFWAYIWYSQGMLIWYANLPEETVHYSHALSNGWVAAFWLNPFVSFVLPFLLLLSSRARKSRWLLGHAAIVSLAGTFLDLLVLVGPARFAAGGAMPPAALGAATAVAAAMLLALGGWPQLRMAHGRSGA